MKSKIIAIIVLTLLCQVQHGLAQVDPDDTQLKRDQQRVEKNTGEFNISYFTNNQNSHLALELQYENGQINIANQGLGIRPGNLPNQLNVGDFTINYYDGQQELIGSYQIESPLRIRSCENNKSELFPVSKATFDILLPKNKTIAFVELTESQEVLERVNVSELMKQID